MRCEAGLYPREIEFLVLADPDSGRIGSGGAAILAAHALRERLERGESALVINAGGESRRMPTYAPEGKLFAPLPLATSTRVPPTVLDLQLDLFLRYPWNDGELVVTSGDVTIDFETDQLPDDRGDLYGFAKPESFELGAQHGVFKFDRNRTRVVDFYQKASVEFLEGQAALEGLRACALDMGIVGFAPKGWKALLSAANAPLFDADGTERNLLSLLQKGRTEVDLYVELLMAFLSGISFERYAEKVRDSTRLSRAALSAIHRAFRDLDFRGYLTRRTKFLHFGSLREYPDSCEQLLAADASPFYAGEDGELRPLFSEALVQFNSIDSTCIAAPGARHIYLEGCDGCEIAAASGRNLFVGLTKRRFTASIPAALCLDERATATGRFLLAYGVDDTWRPQRELSAVVYCGRPLDHWASERGIDPTILFDEPRLHGADRYDLWDARLFLAGTDERFAEGYWNPHTTDDAWRRRFEASPRLSLREVASLESLSDREERRASIRQRLLHDTIVRGHGWVSVSEWDFSHALSPADGPALAWILDATDDDLVKIYRRQLLDALCPSGGRRDSIVSLNVDYLAGARGDRRLRRAVKFDQIVWARSPVRLDLAGGWTDTPPFTLREGGEVVNLAVSLNGQAPIQVFCRPTSERAIRIHSIDLGVGESITRFEELEDFHNPGSPFSLPKAALCLLGLTRAASPSPTLQGALEQIGCGLELTLLSAVPKGSGLGTSSILGATILGALERFFGLEVDREELFREVLQVEQMLTTGGGWQDQIGGVAGGVKYIASVPGLRPNPVIHQLDSFVFQDSSVAPRFTLYYTGITRLAKNILQEVVDRVNAMDPSYLFTLRYLKRLARSAREAISRRDLAALARVLDASWEANKRIHPSTTNDEVEGLLGRLRGLYSGMKLLGAGGGGFILFLSDSSVTATRLRERLASIEDDRARLVDMDINLHGLRVTVS